MVMVCWFRFEIGHAVLTSSLLFFILQYIKKLKLHVLDILQTIDYSQVLYCNFSPSLITSTRFLSLNIQKLQHYFQYNTNNTTHTSYLIRDLILNPKIQNIIQPYSIRTGIRLGGLTFKYQCIIREHRQISQADPDASCGYYIYSSI